MNKEPWEHYPHIWKNNTAFFTYLRGHLRLLWSHYPAKNDWKESQVSAPPAGYTGRAKKLGTCHYCNEQFGKSLLEVDHVEQAGKCNSWDTAAEFLHNLLDCNDNWVLACKPCHKIKSYAESQGINFEEARIAKKIIETMKLPVPELIKFLSDNGYNGVAVSNATKRRECVSEILRGNNF